MASGASAAPQRSTGKREQHAVGKKLPSDSPARRAQGQSRADFAVASRPARQEEAGDIQAGQTQQHRRRGEQDPEWLRKPAPQSRMALGRRSEFDARREKPLPALGGDVGEACAASVLVQHRFEPGLQARLSLRHRDAGAKPTQDLHPARPAVQETAEAGDGLRRHGGGNPERGNFADVDAPERRRGHADDGHRVPVDQHLAAHDIGALPSCVFQKSYESTTTGFAPGVWSSSISKTLPSAGSTPSTEK